MHPIHLWIWALRKILVGNDRKQEVLEEIQLYSVTLCSQIDSIVNSKQILLDGSSRNTRLILQNILFASNESILLPISNFELDIIVEYLNKNPHAKIEVDGHTDNIGSVNKNKILSEKRAKAVANYFITKNINKDRIIHKGFGSLRALATNETTEGRKINRRVEFTIVEK